MTNRVALGKLRNGNYGLEISKPGFDVLNPSTPTSGIAFSTEWASTPVVYLSGITQVNTSSTVTVYFTPLGYIPFVHCVIYDAATGRVNAQTYTQVFDSGTFVLYTIVDPSIAVYSNRIEMKAAANNTNGLYYKWQILKIPAG